MHGWSHLEKPCPICSPYKTYVSDGTVNVEKVVFEPQALTMESICGYGINELLDIINFAKRHGYKQEV